MAKVKAFFNRRHPLYYILPEEMSDSLGFDAYPVEVDPVVLRNIAAMRTLLLVMKDLIDNSGAPEDSAQSESDFFADEVRKIFKTVKQDNLRG